MVLIVQENQVQHINVKCGSYWLKGVQRANSWKGSRPGGRRNNNDICPYATACLLRSPYITNACKEKGQLVKQL